VSLSYPSTIQPALGRFDFIVYAQLAAVLTAEFFVKGNPTVQSLSFWGVFAAGFVSRPLGSVLFGHVADHWGRRPCLLATVFIIGAATILIGCLPTYSHIGIAAPILLAVLRLVQGLAIGEAGANGRGGGARLMMMFSIEVY